MILNAEDAEQVALTNSPYICLVSVIKMVPIIPGLVFPCVLGALCV